MTTALNSHSTLKPRTIAANTGTFCKSASLSRWAATVVSFPAMCLFSLLGLLYTLCLNTIAEPDIWWHLRNARSLMQYHSLPSVDTYSYAAAGSPWLNHEWLSEIPYYWAFEAMGLPGVVLVYFVVIGLIFALVYYRACCNGADCKDGALVVSAAAFLATVSIGPGLCCSGGFAWPCFYWCSIGFNGRGRGFGCCLRCSPYGLTCTAPGSLEWRPSWTTLSGLLEGEWGTVVARRWSSPQLKQLLIMMTLSVAALFANPFGYRLVAYPFEFLFRQASNMKYIQEWHSVDFNTATGKMAMSMICLLLAATLFSRRRWRLDEVLILSLTLSTGLSHGRMLFLAALVLPPILAPRVRLFPPYDRSLDKPLLNAVIITGIVAAIIFTFPSQPHLQRLIDEKYPTSALEFMQREGLHGRLFNTYHWGGVYRVEDTRHKTLL